MSARAVAAAAALLVGAAVAPAGANGSHDFDFEFGTWRARLKTRAPLTLSNTWKILHGTSVVRKVWGGRANLGELFLKSGNTHIEALSLRLYDQKNHVWNLYFANAATGRLGPPDVGAFQRGCGVFYDRETYDGKPVDVRFVFSGITATSFRFVQSYSSDHGQTWIENWISTFAR